MSPEAAAAGGVGLASDRSARLERWRGHFQRGQRLSIQMLQLEHRDLLRLAVFEQRELILL